tara:strand:+ start:250 stop:495 length:246 start_codon:yes stop_codon:yes gene_type:complete
MDRLPFENSRAFQRVAQVSIWGINFPFSFFFIFKIMLTKSEKKEYRELGKIIMNGSLDQVHKITSRYMELNQKKYNPFYKK